MRKGGRTKLQTAVLACITASLLILGYLWFARTKEAPQNEVAERSVSHRGERVTEFPDPVAPAEGEVVRTPVSEFEGSAVFEIRFASPADAVPAKVIVASNETARSLRIDASVFVIGEIEAGGILRVTESDWVRAQTNRGESGVFYALANGAAFPFEKIAERHMLCSIPALHRLVVRCRDRSGRPVDGVRVALSMAAVPLRSLESGFDGAVPLMAGGAASLHTAMTDRQGLAVVPALRSGDYCFDIARFGFTQVGGPNPDRDRLPVPAPAGEVEFVLGAVAIAAANIKADSLLSVRMKSESSRGMLRGRDETLILRHCRNQFPDIDVADIRAENTENRAKDRVEIHALAIVDGRIARIREEIDYVPLSEFRGPTEITIDPEMLFDGGTLRVDVVGFGDQRLDEVRFALKGKSSTDSDQGGSTGIVGYSGQDLIVPAGEYTVFLDDSLLRRIADEPTVVVASGLRAEVRATVPYEVVKFRVKLEVQGRDASLAGVSLRIKQDDCPVRMTGGDGTLEFGPYWGRPGPVSVETWAPGFRPVVHRAVLSGSRDVLVIPMTAEG